MKKCIRGILAMALVATTLTQMVPISAKAEREILTGKTASEITAMMGKGWNLGNTLDATGGNKNDIYSHETAWGNPKVVKELIDGVKASGLNTIRIPITWADYIDKNNGYEIYPEYMARVKEIVDYAYDDGLFVIINVHHEEWVNRKDIDKSYAEIGNELTAVWRQISDTFADYDQHLIFEGMNEPRAKGTDYEWTGNSACYEAVNYLDQLFVETVRGNGKGYNNERMLMVPGYAASSNPAALKAIELPKINGQTASNLCVSVHCYSPYNFCLTDNQTVFDPKRSDDTSDIKALFSNLNSLFLSNGIPVVVGECGATNSGDNYSDRQAWFAYMGGISAEYGIPAVIWDNGINGTSGGECHYYFVRETGEVYAKELVDSFITGTVSIKAENIVIDFEPVSDGSHSSLVEPAELGFDSKVYTQMKTNHTEGAKSGFSLRVDSDAPDYETGYSISRFAGHTIRIGAWIYTEDNATVSIGVNGEEKARVASPSDWTQVLFDAEIPEGTDSSLFFKADAKFFIDDLSIEMDPSEALPKVDNEAQGTSNDQSVEAAASDSQNTDSSAGVSDSSASADVSGGNSETPTSVDGSTVAGGSSSGGSVTVIIIIMLALVAVVAAVVVRKRKK